MSGRIHGRRVLAVVAIVVVALSGAPSALAATPDPVLGSPFKQGQSLTYRWGGTTPPSAIRSAINAAIDDSNDTRRSRAPEFSYSSGANDLITYGVDAPCGVNGLACFRRDPTTYWAIYLRENGHRYDWGTLRWCEASDRPDGCYDAENITLDELGHVLGLDHHDNADDDSDYGDAVVQAYSRTKPRQYYNAHGYGRCDIATLQQLYDMASWTATYSTCLDVPTTLTMTATRTSVVAGSVVTFTASLGTRGSGRLSNNPVAGRTVVLQQRTASVWVDVLTMTPGSTAGTYSVGLVMRGTSDLRAAFRKPSGEGLRTSTSSAITVSVTAACTADLCPQGGTASAP